MAEIQLAIGSSAPVFAVPDENGDLWHLAEALVRSAQVLVFYRGDW